MTLVTKKISGHRYFYYQDSVHDGTKNVVVSTCIGRSDLPIEELEIAKEKALGKHLIKICKEQKLIQQTPYHFEHSPSVPEIDVDFLEYIRLIYEYVMKSLTAQELSDIENTFFIKYVHGTTGIEGNTMTESEVNKLLSAGLTSQNKTLNETIEVANYKDLREYLSDYTGEVNERLIKIINKILMKGVIGRDGRPLLAGEYRTTRAFITGIGYAPPPPEAISKQIYYLLEDYKNGLENNIHPVELASKFHQKFEEVHPFQDGNGRTGREIINLMLQKAGFPRIYITEQQRGDYLDALESGNIGEYTPMVDFTITRIVATITFLYSRTSVYDIMMNPDFEREWSVVYGKTLFEKYKKTMISYHESKELP